MFRQIEEAATIIAYELSFIVAGTQTEKSQSWQRPGWFQTATSYMTDQFLNNSEATVSNASF